MVLLLSAFSLFLFLGCHCFSYFAFSSLCVVQFSTTGIQSRLPFYPCHFSFEPCQLFLLAFCIVWILDSHLGPFISISLYRSVMLSSNSLLDHLVQASFPNVSLPCPCFIFSVKLQLLCRTPCPSSVPNKRHDIIQIILYSSTSGKFFRKINCLIPKPMKLSRSRVFISVDLWSSSSLEIKQAPIKRWVQNCNDLKLRAERKIWQKYFPAFQDQPLICVWSFNAITALGPKKRRHWQTEVSVSPPASLEVLHFCLLDERLLVDRGVYFQDRLTCCKHRSPIYFSRPTRNFYFTFCKTLLFTSAAQGMGPLSLRTFAGLNSLL